jgi:hypothetical protein
MEKAFLSLLTVLKYLYYEQRYSGLNLSYNHNTILYKIDYNLFIKGPIFTLLTLLRI